MRAMGNALVCLPHNRPATSTAASSPGVRLVNGVTGQVQHVHETGLKVAEVMLDNLSSFVMPLHGQAPPSSFAALPADHELQQGGLYLLLPMHKLHKRASLQDLSFFARLAEVGGVRTAADLSSSILTRRVASFSTSGIPSEAAGLSAPFTPPRLLFDPSPPSTPRCRSWKPTLHTISEGPHSAAPPPAFAKQLTRLLSKGNLHRHHLLHSGVQIPTC
ncbi:hypothetical protein GOP47_0026064 [Adiantum capillus-veneris]|uniref:Uncharacterized protein n=1 Tax=Adiantum capillus-veneris TaxID=13818 RepID=A0A9D4U2H8_ADICA|nr:hypothetical protein GOP47_0026064 [Adiantum capillus-veneris]